MEAMESVAEQIRQLPNNYWGHEKLAIDILKGDCMGTLGAAYPFDK